MTVWLFLALAIITVFGCFTTFTVWSRRESRVRGLAVAMFMLAAPLVFVTIGSALGWPVPYIPGITIEGGKQKIMATKLVMGDGIYFLVDSSKHAPRYYWTPWDSKLADKIQDMRNKKRSIMLNIPYERSFSLKTPEFYELPQPKVLPDKIIPREKPPVYERGA